MSELTKDIARLLENSSSPKQVELLKLLLSSGQDEAKIYTDSDLEQLQGLRDKFIQSARFEVGQGVKWKRGLKNKKWPKEEQPAIVMEILESPIIQDHLDSGSPYFREPLDIILGMVDNDGSFVTFYYDKRRFELFK